MHRVLTALCGIAMLALSACGGGGDPGANAAPSAPQTAAAPGGAATPAAVAESDLFAFGAGALFVEKPDDNDYKDYLYGPYALTDESNATDWRSIADKPAVLVLELAERSTLTRLDFDTAGLTNEDKSVRHVRVEISDTAANSGFTTILDTELKRAERQAVPLAAPATGRWVRVTALSNYGAEYYGLVNLRGYGTQLTHDASLANVSGTYEGASGWGMVRLKQEGTRVTGCYDYRSGTVAGGTEGRILKLEMLQQGVDGGTDRQLGLFSFSADGKQMLGFARRADSDPDNSLFEVYSGEKISDDVGDCPAIPDWKGAAAKSQLATALEKTGRARLDGINFDFNSATIRAESKPLLDQVAALLKDHGDWQVTLEGHTDNVGGPAFNQTLSTSRAAAVKAYLAAAGVPEGRLESAGFGFDKPVAPNTTAAGRAENRRVEIVKR
ncbi:OmpA family protein [Sphingomonas sp.]|uniref:OmpA family protein n=1 Tax=Sphingomonas sp. TaxID=28214 RepID=UPI002D0135B5|nr:OmpA family protein [Sphingomonas sp.]HWK36081.1 OmpA family protein [Sphingomonas sp.]